MADVIDQKEKLLIEFLLSSNDLFIKCSGILKPEYFEEPLDSVVDFAIKYYFKYHNIPDNSIVHAETGVKLEQHEVTQDEFEYVVDQIEKHCQFSAMRIAILKGADILAEGEDDDETNKEQLLGKINNYVRNALLVSIDKDLGTNYFMNPVARLLKMQETIDARSIGWVNVDMQIDKVKRSEMVLIAGNSGSGKSVVLANIANNMASTGLHAVIISLELNEALIAKRIDSIVTGIPTKEVFERVDELAEKLEELEPHYGSIVVKRMANGSTSNQIRSYLMEYEIQYGRKPDVICVDYLDLMGTNEKIQGNVFDIDKAKAEELREIFEDYNVYGFTASQLNRESVDTKYKSQAHIAGGISKINTADVVMNIIRNEEEKDAGEIHLQLSKLRNAEFSHEPMILYWDDATLRITDKPPKGTKPTKNLSKQKSGPSSRLNEILNKKKKR